MKYHQNRVKKSYNPKEGVGFTWSYARKSTAAVPVVVYDSLGASGRKGQFLAVAIATLAVLGLPTHAAVVDLGVAGTFNVYSLGNFNSSGSGIQGAVAAAGNLTASNYDLNNGNVDGVSNPGYALAVGGNMNISASAIHSGLRYVGGTSSYQNMQFDGSNATTVPVAFTSASAQVTSISSGLSALNSTGTSTIQWGGVYLTGSGSSSAAATDVFNLNSKDLGGVSWFNFSKLTYGETVVLNIAGTSSSIPSGNWSDFKNYNTIFNFYEATSLDISGSSMVGTLLAPKATLTGNGQFTGNIIVGNYNSTMAVNTGNYWVPTNIAGYSAATPAPEPTSCVMLAMGLVLITLRSRRRVHTREHLA